MPGARLCEVMELLGRDRELAVVARTVDDVRAGGGRALGVLGEAGIGKSALLAAIAARAREAGMVVLEGRGSEHESEVPFGLVVDAFDDHVAGLHPARVAAMGAELAGVLPAVAGFAEAVPLGAGAAERFRRHRALRALLESFGRERSVALLLDDLHWADEASIELVLHLLRRPPRGSVLLAVASRPVESALRVLEAARGSSGWQQLDLEPLDQQASLDLLAGVSDAASRERIAREAAGNPLFLRELGAVAGRADGQLPRTLMAAVALEIAALAPVPRALIEGAAVVGDPFDPELAVAAAGTALDICALDGLAAAALVRPTGDGRQFVFRHPLVRRAIYDAARPAWRLAAHERVAAVLERRGARPELRAHHVARFAHPGDEAALALLCEAGAGAAVIAPATAARWYGAGLRLVSDRDVERRVLLLGGIAAAHTAAGRLEESRDAFVELLGLLEPEPTPRRLSAVVACAGVEGLTGRQAAARARLLEALQDAPPDGRAGLLLGLATAAFYMGDAREMRRWAARAGEAARDDAVLLADAEACEAVGALREGNGELGNSTLDRAAVRLHGVDDSALATRLECARQIAFAQVLAERYADAADTTERGLSIARRTHQGHTLAPLLIYRAEALGNLLELDAAHREIDAAEESARLQRSPHLLALALSQRAFIHHLRDAPEQATRDATELTQLVPLLDRCNLTAAAVCSAASIGADQDPERCLDTIERIAGPRLEAVIPTSWTALLLTMVRCALKLDRLADAERWAALARVHAAAVRLPASHVRGATANAELLLTRGQPEQAANLALAAATAGRRDHALRDAAEARLVAGRALAAAGNTQRATGELQRAAADASRGGALRISNGAARELRRLGSRPGAESRRAAHRRTSAQLTQREQDIADLVAAGQSNKQIAATLYLSDKTIANTLTRVYDKLGVRSRTQLAYVQMSGNRASPPPPAGR